MGKGKIVAGRSSHGHEVPANSVRIAVLEIKDNIKYPFPSLFDGNYVEVGQFTCWPKHELLLAKT